MIVDTALLGPDADDLQTYAGLDVCVTLEVMERLREMYGPRLEGTTYAFSRALQAPALDMSLRGIRLDAALRDDAVERLTGLQVHLEARLNELSRAICDRPLNPKSPKQIIELFTEDMRLPPVWKSDKGVRKLSADEDALEKYAQYLYARPIVTHITAIRSLAKQIERLTTGVSADGRMHTSFGIGSTECISGDSLVWTKSGLRPISDIYESPMPLAVWNGATFIVPSRKVKFENQFGKHLMLKHGYELKCSNNHPVMTQRGWVEADKLTLDDSIEVNFGLRALYGNEYISSDSPFAVTKELCEFIGMWLAGGSLDVETNSRYRCRLSNSFRPILERFAELAGSLFSVDTKVYEKEAYFSSKFHCMWMCNVLGLIANSGHGTASRKVIPSALLRAKPALLRALLRGLTLDTHITEHGIIYGTQSSVLRGQIQQCLLLLGIKSSKLNCGNSIKLMIPLKHCGRFLSLVGFVDSRKVSKIACMLNDKAASSWFEPESFGSRALVPISSIIDWKGDVYDLTMPEDSPPQYIAQGITVHNTGRFSSSKFVDGSGCVLPHAEALTRTGWKPLSEITSGEEIAQYDAGNGAISFAPCVMNSFNFKGEMIHGESEQFKLTVTPGHRILHFGHRGKSELVEQAREVVERAQCYVPLAGRFTGGSLNYPPYLAALMADFSRENGGWRGALKRERKIARLLKLFDQYGVRFNEQSAPEGYRRFYLSKGHESSGWPKRWGPWILELTRESAEALVEEARYWDAHDRGSGFIFYTKDEDQARWFATLAHLVGRGATIRLMQQSAKSWSTTPIWCVNVKSRSRALLGRKHWSRRAYEGKVFCPTVPSSFWLVRQDGFISITGNSNLQNLARDDLEDEHNISIRRIFIADEGQVLFSLDREQSESREIGYMIGLLFDDWGYLDAQEAGDTHTMVARLTWADDLPWTGNDREDRALAEKPFHRKGSRRQLAKILAHGSNLFGKPFTLARETYTTEALVERFQSRYFGRFPGIHRFHRWVAQQLQQKRELTTIFGRRRGFFDRTDDDATLRKAIAYLPQSATADRTNLGLYRVWANMRNDIQLLLQVHDSIVFQAPLTSDLEAIVQKAIELTEVALTSPSGRRYVVPGEMKWGFNLGNASEENPRGLRKWKAGKSASEARSLAACAK